MPKCFKAKENIKARKYERSSTCSSTTGGAIGVGVSRMVGGWRCLALDRGSDGGPVLDGAEWCGCPDGPARSADGGWQCADEMVADAQHWWMDDGEHGWIMENMLLMVENMLWMVESGGATGCLQCWMVNQNGGKQTKNGKNKNDGKPAKVCIMGCKMPGDLKSGITHHFCVGVISLLF
uniref:DUF834 domain-containing protein n=1 Tax=Meloidogyne hapla TaxID=6305 RepID=A0A1I8BIV6_MELHA